MLANIPVEDQARELTESRAELESRLGCAVRTLAYPVGSRQAFSAETKRAAREAGYDLAFSFYGGFNPRGASDAFDVRRYPVSSFNLDRFRFQLSLGAASAKYWF